MSLMLGPEKGNGKSDLFTAHAINKDIWREMVCICFNKLSKTIKKGEKKGPKELKVLSDETSSRCCWDPCTCTETLIMHSEGLLEINCHFKTNKVVHANPHLISY